MVFFLVDLDAFFASVEIRDNPALAGKPVIVGALPGHRGVVSACSYEARKFGVHSAMPISQAYRRCPQGVYLVPRMERYSELSEKVMSILGEYTPHLQRISIDEAFLDMSGTERLLGPPLAVGRKIKERVRSELGLALSIGIAPNKYLAKLASEAGKPDGLLQVLPGGEVQFLDGLPLAKLWGVGEKTRLRLQELNITTIPELRRAPEDVLRSMMGEASGNYLYRVVRGEDPGIYSLAPKSRSVSNETTFETDQKGAEAIRRTILELAEQVMYRLMREGLKSNTAVLKLRFADFTTTHAQRTVGHWLTSSDELYRLCLELLGQRWNGSTPVRLVGVGTDNVVGGQEAVQQELFEDQSSRKRRVEEAVTRIREKMDGVKLTKASLLGQNRRRRPPRDRKAPPGP
ncbi:MAG: DNA polymerase IV [Spirochaetes bacterium GWB1_66_5]|nr:MAG: DNA polymerase IV [Spirochaetes bacterium GWB1_66_5]